MSNAILISNLRFEYDKDSKIFSNLSLSVSKGEYVSLIGHNGSGKSTLARLIIGLLVANEGKIEVFDEELNEIATFSCFIKPPNSL